MMSVSIQYAHLAMTLSDELDLRTLRGVAYLEVMQKAVVVVRDDLPVVRRGVRRGRKVVNEDVDIDSDGGEEGLGEDDAGEEEDEREEEEEEIIDSEGRLIITRPQQLRLLTGYYRLTTSWETHRTTPIHFDHAPSCGATWHQHGCTQSWLDFWKEKSKGDSVLGLGLADLLGRLKVMGKEFDRWGSATYMHHDCRMMARRGIQERIKSVEEGLADYFSGEGEIGR